ncbi:MAG: cobalamin-dependent protein [Candidatus Aminicenantes bacterium]|nr:MAG: cobalamin-dependent protein [Candidatus Aminicenantes bacterium]
MKVLLVTIPPSSHSFTITSLILMEPLALEYLGAGVQKNHEVKLLDLRVDTEPRLKDALESFKPDIIGCGPFTHEVCSARQILAEAKKILPGILTVVGGIHATVKPEDFFEDFIDVVVAGEGVEPFKKICDYHEKQKSFQDIENIYYRKNGKMEFTRKKPYPHLDTLPLPARTLTSHVRHQYVVNLILNKTMALANVRASLGCFYRCNFCTIPNTLGHKVYRRSIDSILEELASIKESVILWVDDEFFLEHEPAMLLARAIDRAGIKKYHIIQSRSDTIIKKPECTELWAKIGLKLIFIGMESHREKDLKKMNKGTSLTRNEEALRICHINNVSVRGGFIVQPDFDKKEFNEFARYVRKSEVDVPNLTVLTPFPGTRLYEETKQDLITADYDLFDMIHPVLPTKLPLKKFFKELSALFLQKSMSIRKRIKLFRQLPPEVRKDLFAKSMDLKRKLRHAYQDYDQQYW